MGCSSRWAQETNQGCDMSHTVSTLSARQRKLEPAHRQVAARKPQFKLVLLMLRPNKEPKTQNIQRSKRDNTSTADAEDPSLEEGACVRSLCRRPQCWTRYPFLSSWNGDFHGPTHSGFESVFLDRTPHLRDSSPSIYTCTMC